ncbi:4'-phosphopantetheinyl transferase family protein [Neolewinella antarctica]|uniref:Phosphopantetheinyl transferase n=1 Tax=Neolewinella antarctica TaxID=442734 RepID=A0ABX0X9D6_9BACT|nr:4'-phosphopantetheinyl transferase superfamily protein [Neolewinella antarctica]NJC25544.1 phosphopantetheinyl transferase [Neolewinella antarctica]
MPVQFHEPLRSPGEWGLFHITETEDVLLNQAHLYTDEARQLSLVRGKGHRKEFLAARILLHQMSGRSVRGELRKDTAGKPHLADSHFHVSISHTVNYAAAVAHPNPCGVDVQRIVGKIARIAPRFMSTAETVQLKETNNLVQMHLIWSAKEAMYKAFGRRQIDFKEHLYVDLGNFSLSNTTAAAVLRTPDVTMVFDLDYRIFDDFVVVACVESLSGV